MLVRFLSILLMSLLIIPNGVQGQDAADEAEASAAPLVGLWPSPRMAELMIGRWADGVSVRYELDDEQFEHIRDTSVKRWGSFLKENRSKLQPLINEFIEMHLELKPPEKEAVQKWARRAGPLLDRLEEQVSGALDDFREVLNPLQVAEFEREVMQFGAGMKLAKTKLAQWQRGEFEIDEFWDPPPSERHRRREARRRAAEEVEPEKPLDQIEKELVGWDAYVDEFIRRFDLDRGQRDAARSCLTELKLRALAHRDRRRDEIVRLEQRIATHTGSEADLAETTKQLTELYGPIDEMFKELERRIERIPTAEQRAKVASEEAAKSSQPPSADAEAKAKKN